MSDAEHFRRLEAIYRTAPCNEPYRPELRVSEGQAELTFAVRPSFFHAAGAVHGSVYFKALDDAAFFAANSLVCDVFVLTTSFQLYLMAPVSDGVLRATGRVVHRARNHFLAESELYDDQGTALARGSGTFVRSRFELVGARPE